MTNSIEIYSYSRCGTCRKALAWLDLYKFEYKLIDIIESPPSKELLQKAFDQFEDRKLVFNTSGLSYRKLGSVVIRAMNDHQAIEALACDGKLIKRPFVVINNTQIFAGFKPLLWEEFLLN